MSNAVEMQEIEDRARNTGGHAQAAFAVGRCLGQTGQESREH